MPTPQRIIATPTALSLPEGTYMLTGFAGGLWNLQYQVNKYLRVGAMTNVPIYAAGIAGTVALNLPVGRNFAIGAGGIVGVFGPYVNASPEFTMWVVGGHLAATLHSARHVFNFGIGALSAGMGKDRLPGAFIPFYVGYRALVHRNWSLQIEVVVPTLAHEGGWDDLERAVVIFYGVRGHGKVIFGDVGFMIIAQKELWQIVGKYVPIGFPYFTLGFKF